MLIKGLKIMRLIDQSKWLIESLAKIAKWDKNTESRWSFKLKIVSEKLKIEVNVKKYDRK